MKTIKRIAIIGIAIIFVNLFAGCGIGEDGYGPRATIYKTSGDYFNNVNTWGDHNAPVSLDSHDGRIIIENGDTVYRNRIKLIDGYILAKEISGDDYFTDITYPELVAYNENHAECFPIDSVFKRLIDKDPFTAFYIDKEHRFGVPSLSDVDSAEIEELNEIIRNGELETYFDKIK